ncbi:MAG: GGDEF domain-containing protein [Candidatus Dormibacteria bacterium]
MSRTLVQLAASAARSLSGETPIPARRTLAYSGGFLYLSGATLVTISLLIERSPGTKVWLSVPALLVAFAVSFVLIGRPELLPVSGYPYLTALGTVLISVLAWADGSSASAESLLYVWVSLYAFYFYGLRLALLEVWVVAAAAGVEMATKQRIDAPIGLWLMTVGTSLIGGLAIRQLVTQVRWLADRDGLTGLHNRRRLMEDLDRDLRRCERTTEPLALLMLDLDRFKEYNDLVGHIEGDRHLREVAARWSAELRRGDVLARFGGEEFVVVMPSCSLERAVAVADRLRTATPNEQTASAGAVCWDGREDALSLLTRADAALYEAKQAGRDRTVAASGEAARLS